MKIRTHDPVLTRRYTIKKRNIDKIEKVIKRNIYNKYIKLYAQWNIFPNWAKLFTNQKYLRTNERSIDFEFYWELRPYQIEALMHVEEYQCGLIEAATGSWKSLVAIWLINFFKVTTLIVCPTKKLVSEMVDKFKKFTNYEPWTYYSDWKNIKDITITTHASFVKDMGSQRLLTKFCLVIVDEADEKSSEKFIQSLCVSDCDILVGMSGTPSRQDLNLEDMELVFGPHVKIGDYQMLPTEITHNIYAWPEEEADEVNYTNWHTQRESILANKNRFKAVVEKIKEFKESNHLCLLLLDRIEEVERFSESFPEALVITWHTKIKDDEAWIKVLEKSWWLIIGSIKKMYRGVDIPSCDCVIIASPIRFENTVIQSIWRALRAFDGKEKVSIQVINDDILTTQRREQTKSCKQEYWIKTENVYI